MTVCFDLRLGVAETMPIADAPGVTGRVLDRHHLALSIRKLDITRLLSGGFFTVRVSTSARHSIMLTARAIVRARTVRSRNDHAGDKGQHERRLLHGSSPRLGGRGHYLRRFDMIGASLSSGTRTSNQKRSCPSLSAPAETPRSGRPVVIRPSRPRFVERIGADCAYVSGLELGQRNPTVVTLWHIAEALGVKRQSFFKEAKPRPNVGSWPHWKRDRYHELMEPSDEALRPCQPCQRRSA